MTDLLEVARQYDREAGRAVSASKVRHLRSMAASLRYMAGNRDAVDPGRLRLQLGLRLDLTIRWCRRHGYKASIGADGVVLQRNNEPAHVASIGDTLRWDGQEIRVERGT